MDKNRKLTINFNNYEPKSSREEKNRIAEKDFNKEKKNRKAIYNIDRNKTEFNNTRIRLEKRRNNYKEKNLDFLDNNFGEEDNKNFKILQTMQNEIIDKIDNNKQLELSLNEYTLPKRMNEKNFYTSNNNEYYNYQKEKNIYRKQSSKEKRKVFDKNKILDSEKKSIMNKLIMNQRINNHKKKNANKPLNDLSASQHLYNDYKANQMIYHSINNNIPNSFINNNVHNKSLECRKRKEREGNNKDKGDYAYYDKERSFNNGRNYDDNNDIKNKGNNKTIRNIKLKNLNFHKNNSSNSIYCSPKKKIYSMNHNKNNIENEQNANNDDDKYPQFERSYDNINRKNLVLNNNDYIYKKCSRNDRNSSLIKDNRILGSEFNKNIKILNEKNLIGKTFNSPMPTCDKRNVISQTSSVKKDRRIGTQNRSLSKNSKVIIPLNEFRKGDRSKYGTMENIDEHEDENRSFRRNNKKYFYQLDNNDNNNNNKYFSINNNIYQNKTIERRAKGLKLNDKDNSLEYNNENSVNSNDINYSKYRKSNWNPKNKEKIYIEDNRVQEDGNDNMNQNNNFFRTQYDFGNKIKSRTNFDDNADDNNNNILNRISNKKIKTRGVLMNSVKKRQLANSFDYEIDNENGNENGSGNYKDKNNINENIHKNSRNSLITQKGKFNDFNEYLNYRSNRKNYLNSNYNSISINSNASPVIYKTKRKINKIGKGSPKKTCYGNDNVNGNDKEEASYNIKKNENDYYNKTVEEYYKNNLENKPNLKGKSKVESAVGPTQRNSAILYNKRNSQNNIALNNSKNSNSNDTNNPDFNKTYYAKKSSTNSIYHKKNIKSKISDISSTTENKTIKKDQNDNLSMNSSHNSNNNKNSNLNHNKNISNKYNDNMSSSNNENDDIIIPRNESSFSINKAIFNDTHCFFKKFYQYNIKKPINKIYYMKKDIKIKNKNNNKKNENEDTANNLSIVSENKNDFNSSNISFSNNKNKKKVKNMKEPQTEKILLNGKNIVYDYDSKDNSEFNFDYETPNSKNKNNGNSSKNEKNNNGIKLNFSDEKNEDKILINNDKDEKELLKKNIIKYIPVKEETSENKENILNTNSDIYQIKNEINDKNISLATKKLNDLLMKKNGRHFTYSKEKKKKKFRRSFTEEQFILGYSKLNDIFDKKYNKKNSKDRTNNINVMWNKFNNNINDKIEEEEVNDIDSDDFELNKKAYTYKVNKKSKLLEKLDDVSEKDTKTYKLEKILSLKNKDLSLKDNLLNNEVKSHINDLIEPEYKVGKLNTNTLKTNNLIKLYKKIDNKNNSKEKEKGIEDKIIDLLDILNKENITSISEQLINIIYYDNSDNNSNKQNNKIISKKYIDNINHFVNIIYHILLNENKDLNLYSQLCNKINYLLLKESNYKDENNLENIIIKEYLKIITNQEFINSVNNEEFENIKNKIIDLSNFIIELTSFKLIEIKKCLNIIFQLFKEYEKEYKNNNVKYLYLEICVYIFDSVLEFPKIEDNIYNLIDDIFKKLNNSLQERKLPNYLKEKIINIIDKKKQKLNKEDKQEKRSINKRISEDLNKLDDLINNNKINIDKKEENKINNNKIYKYEKRIDSIKDNKEEKEIKVIEDDDLNNNIKNKEIEDEEDLINNIKFDKINNNSYNKCNTFIPKKSNDDIISDIYINKNDVSAEIKKNYNVTHKKKSKSKKKSRSIEKRPLSISKPINFKEELSEEDKKIKQEIKEDFENYVTFLERKRIRRKEDIYNDLNNSFNWNSIDDLITNKNVRLEEIIKFFIEICKEKNISNDDIFKANEYIKTIIEYYFNDLSKNQKDIFHLNMIEIYMAIDDLVENCNENSNNMHEIMGNLLYILLKNKLYFMKDLNTFFEKSKETQINIAKVVKFTIIASGNNAKKYHNDFKYTKLFNNNDIFNLYVTNKLNELKII